MNQTRNFVPGLILLVTVAVLSSAYSAQYIGGLRPCILCLYERIPWFAAGGLMLLVILLSFSGPGRRALLLLAGVILLGGAVLAGYHVGVEQQAWAGPGACSAPEAMPQSLDELKAMLENATEPRCDQIPWELFGISLAGYNAIASGVLALVALETARRRR